MKFAGGSEAGVNPGGLGGPSGAQASLWHVAGSLVPLAPRRPAVPAGRWVLQPRQPRGELKKGAKGDGGNQGEL